MRNAEEDRFRSRSPGGGQGSDPELRMVSGIRADDQLRHEQGELILFLFRLFAIQRCLHRNDSVTSRSRGEICSIRVDEAYIGFEVYSGLINVNGSV